MAVKKMLDKLLILQKGRLKPAYETKYGFYQHCNMRTAYRKVIVHTE